MTTVGVISVLILALLLTLIMFYSVKWVDWHCEYWPVTVYIAYSFLYLNIVVSSCQCYRKMLHKDKGVLGMKVTVHLVKLTSGLHADEELRDFRL